MTESFRRLQSYTPKMGRGAHDENGSEIAACHSFWRAGYWREVATKDVNVIWKNTHGKRPILHMLMAKRVQVDQNSLVYAHLARWWERSGRICWAPMWLSDLGHDNRGPCTCAKKACAFELPAGGRRSELPLVVWKFNAKLTEI